MTRKIWEGMHDYQGRVRAKMEVYRLVYYGGVEHKIRKEVWPYLLGHYAFNSTPEERTQLDDTCKRYYETTMGEWLAAEAVVRQREKERTARAMAKLSAEQAFLDANANVFSGNGHVLLPNGSAQLEDLDEPDLEGDNDDVFDDNDFSDISEPEEFREVSVQVHRPEEFRPEPLEEEEQQQQAEVLLEFQNIDDMEPLRLQENCFADSEAEAEAEAELGLAMDGSGNVLMLSIKSSPSTSSYETVGNEFADLADAKALDEKEQNEEVEGADAGQLSKFHSADDVRLDEQHPIIIEAASLEDIMQADDDEFSEELTSRRASSVNDDEAIAVALDALQEPKSNCVSPASSNGQLHSEGTLEKFTANLERIEKDVLRCDRNYWYFTNENNLDKLRNVITTYVWEHQEPGYMQGMCDLLAPLLVILDDEALTYSCFNHFMERMIDNFPNTGLMDLHFANIRWV